MASGGARSRSGPPPDPNALRRDRKDDGEWLTLPAGGRDGEPPEWPLTTFTGEKKVKKAGGRSDDDASVFVVDHERELELWRSLWAKPQAVAWEKLGLEYEVGLLVRRMSEAEQPGSHTSTGTLVRQMMDSLGLTTPGLRSNRWRLSDDELGQAREEKADRPPSSRDRFRVVKDDADAG